MRAPSRFYSVLLSFRASKPTAAPFLHDYGAWGGINAAISDASGNLLFSCDGNAIYDAEGYLLPTGSLNAITQANPWWERLGTQATVIVPSPGRPKCYHTFYWDKAADPRQGVALRYVVVDMRQRGGRGGIVERSGPVAYTAMPRITAVRHRNNRDFWPLTRDEDTRGFVALRLTAQGLAAAPVVSLAGTAQYPSGAADLKVSPDGRRVVTGGLAVQGRTATGAGTALGGVCLYDFDNGTGAVANEQVVRQVALPGYGTDGQGRLLARGGMVLYSASFSPDGTKLYTTESAPFPVLQNAHRFSDIWQYDLAQPAPAGVRASRYLVSNVPTPAPSAVDTTISHSSCNSPRRGKCGPQRWTVSC